MNHLEYRFNISKSFSPFIYGGVSGNLVTDSNFEYYDFQHSYDYGAGIRFNHFQINVERNIGENNVKDWIFSCSYMF